MRSIFTFLAVGFMAISAIAKPVHVQNTRAGVISSYFVPEINGQGGWLAARITSILPKGLSKAEQKEIYHKCTSAIGQVKYKIEKNLPVEVQAILAADPKATTTDLDATLSKVRTAIINDHKAASSQLEATLDNILASYLKGSQLSASKAALTKLIALWTAHISNFCPKCDSNGFKGIKNRLAALKN